MSKSGTLLLIATFFLCLCALGQEISKEDVLRYGINSITYIDSPGTPTKEVYNDRGDLIRRTFTFSGKTIDAHTEYEYNDSLQVVRSIHFMNGKHQYTSIYSYTHGRLSREEMTQASKTVSVRAIEYDKKGNKVKELLYLKGAEPFRTIKYTYNERNLLMGEVTTDHQARKKTAIVYTYNDKGQLIKKESEAPPAQGYTTTRVYDDSGRVVKSTYVGPQGDSSTTTYTYGSNGLLAGTEVQSIATINGKKVEMRSKSTVVVSIGPAKKAERMLFVVDSVPILKDPEPWDPVAKEDWADMRVLRDKDSIKFFGWENVDAITFIFTKAYRTRPDSLKSVPNRRHLEQKEEYWHLHGVPYSGRYIEYYHSGRIMNEGNMKEGRLHGPFIVYYPNGHKKSVALYKEGVLHGDWKDYYPSGELMQWREFIEGKSSEARKEYFINGQLQYERRLSQQTPYDTAVAYYSTGKLKQMTLFQEGRMVYNRKADELRMHTNDFYRGLRDNNLKEANKAYFLIWKTDSASADTYFKGGLLMLKEYRFDEAIVEFNRALGVEPLFADAFVYRALARLKKYKPAPVRPVPKDFKEPPLALKDLTTLTYDEQLRVCDDLQRGRSLGFAESELKRIFPGAILGHCGKKTNP